MTQVSYAELLRNNRNFRLYWGGQIVSQLGDWFSLITVQAMLLHYSGSATSVGWYIVAQMGPLFILGPFAGVLVDRLPRKAVMIGADIARALIALGLLLVRGPETAWIGYACVAGLSAFSAFFEPARIATLPNITSDEELVTANALSSVTWSILLTSGALVGGLTARYLGTDVSFIANSLSFVLSAGLLSFMRVPDIQGEEARAGGVQEIIQGIRYVVDHPEIAGALTAKLGWGLAGGVQSLLAIYGQRIYPLPGDTTGELSIALLFAAGGVGTALGPIIARRFTGRDLPRIRWAIAVSFLAAAVYYACMGLAPNLFFVGLFLLLARMHGAVVWVFSTVLLQILVQDRFRGRVFAAETSLFTATMMVSNMAVTNSLDAKLLSVGGAAMVLGALSGVVGVFWVGRLLRGGLPAATPAPVPETARGDDG